MAEDTETVETVHRTIEGEGDVELVRLVTSDAAADVGFEATACEELGLVATELAANVLEHAGGGEVTVATITDGTRDGIRVESQDAGPGIPEIGEAFADTFSTAGSLGRGLGAVNRLTDEVTVTAPGEPDYGTHIVADRWVRPEYETSAPCPFSFGAASRPKQTETANGDSFILKRWDDSALVGVIDGLGHGVSAHKAAMAAKEYVESHYDNAIASIFRGTERACTGTRGVVMALARVDWAAGELTFGGVGNIASKSDPNDASLVVRRGVLGKDGPDPRVTTAEWPPDSRLIMFSDGVESHWRLEEYDALFENNATVIARTLLDRLGKDHDDATVLVVSPDRDGGQAGPSG